MPVRKSEAEWKGGLKDGKGKMRLGSGAFEGKYNFSSRFEEGTGTNPEEMIGAAHAGCFSMQLAHLIKKEGYEPESVKTEASVTIEKVEEGFAITSIHLKNKSKIPGIDEDIFKKLAQSAKENCPVSKALAATDISLDAELIS